MYDNVGQYEASVSLTETVSGNVATGDIVVVAEVATAYDADGFESDYSQEVVWTSPVENQIIPSPLPIEEPVLPVAEEPTSPVAEEPAPPVIEEPAPPVVNDIDSDNDGFSADVDCNDNDSSINPAAMDIACDNIDQDCSGTDFIDTPCRDSDNDGLLDIIEDANQNGLVDAGETDSNNPDTDEDGLLDGAEDANHDSLVDPDESDPLDPADPCSYKDYNIMEPRLSATPSPDNDLVLIFDSSLSACYEMVSCTKEERSCIDVTGSLDFGGEGEIIGGNGHDIIAYRYDTAGNYRAELTMTDTLSQATSSSSLVPAPAEIVETPAPFTDFYAEVNNNTVTLTTQSLPAELIQFTIYWGDRNYSTIHDLTNGIEHVYPQTGTHYNIRITVQDSNFDEFNYTFMDDEDLTVYIPAE
jgi:hypothetical protein